MPDINNYVWIKVKPITWVIRNWNKMPQSINPNGNGKAAFINVRTEESIMSGIPFYSNTDDENIFFWQNSSIRGFLNGINVCNIKTNGNAAFSAPNGGNFSGHGFLQEVFSASNQQILTNDENTQSKEQKEHNPYGFVYDNLKCRTIKKLLKTSENGS